MSYCNTTYSQPINPRVTELLRRGVQLRQQGRDEAALREFEAASRLSQEPRVTAQIALAEQALQHWIDADRHLRLALLSAQDDYIARHRVVLETALAEIDRHLGGVLVTGGVDGAEVWVGSERIGTLPMREPAWIEPGRVRVEVRAPGYATTSRDVTTTEGGTTREEVTLAPARSPARTGAAVTVRPPSPLDGVTSAERSSGSAQRTWGWVTLGGGALLAAGGVVALLVHSGNITDFNDRGCYVPVGSTVVMGPSDSLAACNADHDSIGGTLGIVGLAGGGALMALSIVLLATAPSQTTESRSQTTWLGCGRGPGQFGIACAGTF
jgi:hypothetical protein